MKKFKRKKIFIDKKHFVWVRLFRDIDDLRAYYKKDSPNDGQHDLTLGVHLAQTWLDGKKRYVPRTGEVLLAWDYCGSGIVSHEFMHAVIWAHRHNRSKHKKQYPFLLKNMKEEEKILHRLTDVVRKFYSWYWELEEEGFGKKKKV